jgi:soluble lytic murein transglycosylase-like protein
MQYAKPPLLIGLLACLIWLNACTEREQDISSSLPAWLDSISTSLVDTAVVAKQDTANIFKKHLLTLLGPGKISRYDYIIKKFSRRYGFDWRFISAQIFAESGFNERAVSPNGAMGLMQIMPRTAKYLGKDPSRMFRPSENISLGCYYNRMLFCKFDETKGYDRLAFMLAAYNAGPGHVRRAQKMAPCREKYTCIEPHLPGQTRHYVPAIMKMYDHYRKTVAN